MSATMSGALSTQTVLSSILSCNQSPLNTYCVPDTVLVAGGRAVIPRGICRQWEKKAMSKISNLNMS